MNAVKGSHSTRRAKAAVTRKRIIEAASVEFIANGYHGAVMAAIADRAGVAVQTVYFVFHTKPELFAAALDAAVLGPEDKPPLQQSWAADAAATTDPVAALRSFINASASILERAAALSEVAYAAAVTDPELAAVYHSRDTLRSDGYRDFVHQLRLPPGVDAGLATDILIALHSPRLYLALREDRGWTHQQVTSWMTQTIPDLVLRPSPPTAPTPEGAQPARAPARR